MNIVWLNDIPNEVWVLLSGLFGGALTLLVTFIQSGAELKRLNKQHEYEERSRYEERSMSMRQEIYYGAIESIANSVNLLSLIIEKDFHERQQITSLQSFSQFQKVQLIAGEEVLESFNHYSDKFSESFASLFPKKIKLQKLEIDHSSNESLQGIASEARKDIIQRMEKLNSTKNYDPAIWESLNKSFADYGSEIEGFSSKNDELIEEIFFTKMDIIRESLLALKIIKASAGKVIIAMRKELDSKVDDKTFLILEKLVDESNAVGFDLSEKMLNDMEAMVLKE